MLIFDKCSGTCNFLTETPRPTVDVGGCQVAVTIDFMAWEQLFDDMDDTDVVIDLSYLIIIIFQSFIFLNSQS